MRVKETIWLSFLLAVAAVKAQAQISPTATTSASATNTPVATPATYNLSAPVNFIRAWQPAKPITDYTTVTGSMNVVDVKMTSQYFDGLGRLIQTVSYKTTPGSKDAIATALYDELGRETYQYLPYPSRGANGQLRLDPFNEQQSYYSDPSLTNSQYTGEQFYYGKNLYDNSPLNRAVKTMPAGNSWSGSDKGTSYQYVFNTATEGIRIWKVDLALGSVPYTTNTYPDNTLSKTITTDEHDKQVQEYRNKEGKVVLKKVQIDATPSATHTGWLCTYYVFDDNGLLRCVVQPKAIETMNGSSSWILSSNLLDEYCFRYEYDERDRMIVKKVPGAGEVHLVYDQRDRLVLSQDANLRNQSQWMYTKYDGLNRVMSTGLLNSTSNRATHQAAAGSSSDYPNLSGYTYEELTVNYYDDYSWSGVKTYQSSYVGKLSAGSNPYPEAVIKSDLTYGQLTGTKVKVLGTSQYLITTTYYDDKGRVIQMLSDNTAGGVDVLTSQYDFSGKILSTYLDHQNPLCTTTPQTKVLTKVLYDQAGRLLKTWKQVNDSGVDKLIAENSYDELGNPKTKKLAPEFNSGAGLETLDYTYNLRGWLKGVNKDYANASGSKFFGMELSYDYGFSQSQLNGNIAGIKWRSKGDGEQRAHGFGYDAANRLLKADFTQNNGGWNTSAGVDFSMKVGDGSTHTSAYDANGNLLAMKQWGLKINSSLVIDDVSYAYKTSGASNKLASVTESTAINSTDNKLGDFTDKNRTGDDYDYDANGNLILDKNKNIASITYNHLNLPSLITVTGKGTIQYVYDAAGTKVKKITTEGSTVTTTLYLSGAVYENNVLQFIGHEEGRIRYKPSNTSFQFDYFVKDHLGNVRMVLTEEQLTDIYPAATMEGSLTTSTDAAYIEKQYYIIDAANVVDKSTATGITDYPNNNGYSPINNNPNSNTTANSQKLYKLLASSSGGATGLGITLKVMSGDRLDIFGKSYYFQSNSGQTNYSIPVLDVLSGLLGAPTSTAGSKGATASGLNGQSSITTPIGSFLSDVGRGNGTTPKAYINWILFDENFKYVSGNFSRVGSANVVKSHYTDAALQNIQVTKNGYLYVYVSNESPVAVFFDNLQVTHIRGPLLEETHYYPFGLTMQGISSKAAGGIQNRLKYNGKEEQRQEFLDGSGLDWLDYGARMYDVQVGRWHTQDPLSEQYRRWSPYNYGVNNPIRFIDPDGMAADDFVRRSDGSIYWDKDANDQATTKTGETYLGKTLTFTFNSYIDTKLWDGPMGSIPTGDKLTTTVYVTGNENEKGELTSVSVGSHPVVGSTPVGTGRNFYPGLGADQNKLRATATADGGFKVSMEQHASVSPSEQFGLNQLGYNIVNVAQKLDINISAQGNVLVSAFTDIFPSATLTINGGQVMQYNQPSFEKTHSFPVKGYMSQSGSVLLPPKTIYDYSLKPAAWYKRL